MERTLPASTRRSIGRLARGKRGGIADQPIYALATLILMAVLIYLAYTWLSSKPEMITNVFGRTLDMLSGAFEGFLG